nr:hypothetical protein [uncultured Rhodopila sp.]
MSAAVSPAADDPLPVKVLGVLQRGYGPDLFWFRIADGTTVALEFTQLATRQALISLLGGEAWLRRNFPGQFTVLADRDGGGRRVPTGINVLEAARHLSQLCIDAEVAAQAAAANPPRRSWWDRVAELLHGGFTGWGMML